MSAAVRVREDQLSAVEEILAQIPLSELAAQLGVDEQTAEQATRQALPALLGGMHANAQDGGESSLVETVQQHAGGLLDGGVDLGKVDAADGAKIVGHVFGGNQEQVINQLGGVGNLGSSLMSKLLPLLAPIVMAYLAKKLGGGQAQGQGQGGGALGDLLGGLLGGAGGGAGLGGLGDLLGGLLGGAGRPRTGRSAMVSARQSRLQANPRWTCLDQRSGRGTGRSADQPDARRGRPAPGRHVGRAHRLA